VPADVPLEESPRRLTGAAGARGSHAWDRSFLVWDGYFAVVWAGTVLFALAAKSPGPAVRLAAVALFTLEVPWYLWAGRPLLLAEATGTRASARYLAGLVALFLAAAVLVGETRLATFALVPQCFMLLRIRRALAVIAVINIAPVVGWGALWRPDPRDLYLNSVFAAVTLVFAAVIGSWIIGIIGQSKERADLIAELDASREEISRLSTAHGALAERERMSREIHDTLAQGFTSLLMLVQAVESELDRDVPRARLHLELMAATARQNLAEARALVVGGAPADLDGGSLPEALWRLAGRHTPAAPVRVIGTARALPAVLEVVALRSCQEALTNAYRHAGPGASVTIALGYEEDALTLSVRDTGLGFDPAAPQPGFGLGGLRVRATEVGGHARVHSAPGEGTTVTVRLPVPLLRSDV
jgi:signal transduction histidine kinase